MAAGQGAFWVAADVAALDALEGRLQVQEARRGAAHVQQLRTVLELHALYSGRGLGISTVPHAALVLGASESRGAQLLRDGLGLAELPGALEAVECGLLTVEQSAVVVQQLAVLPLPARVAVWRRLQARLVREGSPLPPARLTELLRRWVQEADPADAVARRKKAEQDRKVDYRRRDDGLGDLFAFGFRSPNLHAVLSRIAARSAPWGAEDDRSADQRRFDAFQDLLLGRDDSLPFGQEHCGSGCGCRAGEPVPCGSELVVHVPLGGALGTTDEAAELVGHGPIEPDLLQDLLLAAPRLRPVWVDEDGVVVAVGEQVVTPQRGDPGSVRQALLHLASLAPPRPQPRHPDDHAAGLPGAPTAHPPEAPGPYRPPRWLRRLIELRAPRCEWPGCGARAVLCDSEHDRAWPEGPTCACNLGPCCRRHHQVKQQGWIKTRSSTGVRWTGPTGRSWFSAVQHRPPAAPVRPLPPVPSPNPFDELTPSELEDELWALDLLPVDTGANHHPPLDREPLDRDRLGQRLTYGDTRWTLDLDDPYPWLDPEVGGGAAP
jgi:hypothetical protein